MSAVVDIFSGSPVSPSHNERVAQHYAAMGVPVAPCRPGDEIVAGKVKKAKSPLTPHGIDDATTDPATIAAWWARWPDALVGLGLAKAGLIAIDADRHGGPDGVAAWEALCAEKCFDASAQPKVSTPSGGGSHTYWRAPAGVIPTNGEGDLPKGINVRWAGYTIAPGCILPDGRSYEPVEGTPPLALDIPEAPAWLIDMIGKARPRGDDSQTPVADQDTPAILACAAAYLAERAPAIEGQGGDLHTLQTALDLRDMGCSEPTTFDLMAGGWNDRCSPPWDLDELRIKVGNAFLYAQNPPGVYSPDADLRGIAGDIPAPVYITRPGPTTLPVLDLQVLGGLRAPERLWAVEGMIPLLKATMLTGKGGVGKSLLAQLLSTCAALGVPFLGMPTRPGKATYISWEDDAEELWRRQESICAVMGVPMADLAGKLALISMTKEPDSLLVTFDAAGNRTVTSRGQQLEAYAVGEQVRFVAFDNASHLLGGDHNDVKHVAGFAHWLNSFAERIAGATLLLHHPNKSGDDWLGSVAYENQFRSRLFMDRPLDSVDPNARVLTNPKANYAASGGEVRFRWWQGSFMRDIDLSAEAVAEIVDSAEVLHDNAIFLACLAERNKQLRPVSERPSRTYAPAVFAEMPESKGIGRKRLQAAMDRLFKNSTIARTVVGWDTVKRRPMEGVREVGAATNAPNPRTEPPQTPPLTLHQTRPEPSPEPPPHHTPYTTYMGAAASMAAAIPHSDGTPPSPASLF